MQIDDFGHFLNQALIAVGERGRGLCSRWAVIGCVEWEVLLRNGRRLFNVDGGYIKYGACGKWTRLVWNGCGLCGMGVACTKWAGLVFSINI